MSRVVDHATANRLEIREAGQIAELTYTVADGRLVLNHTGVPDELEGRGIGGELVRGAVDKARAEGLAIVPNCSFARGWLERHADAHDGVEVLPVG